MFTVILIVIINPLVSNAGHTVLLRLPKLFFWGPTRITFEAIMYGLNMALKFICIVLLFVVYDILTDKDEVFGFFSKYSNRLTLTVSITTNVIHRLLIDIYRVKEVMALRGVNFNEKKLLKKIKAYYPIIKVVFISSLEGSLDRAESLFSRQYGKRKRTSYYEILFRENDYKFLGITLLLLILFIISVFYHYGSYKFYPELSAFKIQEIWHLIIINCTFLMFGMVIKGVKDGGM
jgi:energy-coupling factor transport system permease protein